MSSFPETRLSVRLVILAVATVLGACASTPDYGRALPEGAPALIPLADGEPIPDISSAWFRLRKQIVKSLSTKNRDRLARLKARVAPTGRF